MSEYKIPEDGLRAALMVAPGATERWEKWLPRVLEVFIAWQSENPPVAPLHVVGRLIADYLISHPRCCDSECMQHVAVEWIRRMYLAPEPKPFNFENVRRYGHISSETMDRYEWVTGEDYDALLEAYRLMKQGKQLNW